MISTRVNLPPGASLLDGGGAARHLTTILRTYGIRGSSVAHDKIYGLLGLSDAFAYPDLNPPGIHYDQRVEEVYTDWARFLIKPQGDLGLLYVTQRMEHSSELPSWAPDWRTPRQDFFLRWIPLRTSLSYASQLLVSLMSCHVSLLMAKFSWSGLYFSHAGP